MKNKTMYAILGILNISPSSGYDIKKYCDTVLSGFWNENFGHIYPTLKKMQTDGVVEVATDVKNEKKIQYRITSRGKQELEEWLLEETELQPVRSEFMLKLLFSSNQPKENILEMLEKYKKVHTEKLEKYLLMQTDLEKETKEISRERERFVRSILRSGILSCEATIRWCNETIEEMTNT
jgi:DNA-binding PadR family transcriptional regulator